MNIVNFTPVTALTGGLLIGLSVALFFILNGRMIGISGIASNFLISKDNRIDNFLFLVGLILGPFIYNLISGKEINISISNSLILLITAGAMVGFGTRLSSGCTSGHGISGIASNFLVSKNNRIENFLFLVGLILGPLIYNLILGKEINISISNSLILLIVGGTLVGFGTRLSSGCTSGHGISGISRFSLRSIIATITFMIVGILTVLITGIL